MLISICYGTCGPYSGDKEDINDQSCFLPTPPPLGGLYTGTHGCVWLLGLIDLIFIILSI